MRASLKKSMSVKVAVPEQSPTLLFASAPVSPCLTACVVIPVKNEEAHITQTLTALAQQVDLYGEPLDPATFEILILANNCTDNSVARIEAFSGKHPTLQIQVADVTLPPAQANIGYVRRLLMDAACHRLWGKEGGLILTTDGDTQVTPDWIAQTQAEIAAGADAVGGRILFCPAELRQLDARTRHHHLQDEQYLLLVAELEAVILQRPHDPAPTHHQHFNGSFAVTARHYAKAGGIPDVPHLEDCAFYERLQRIDANVRHSPHVVVYTSARYAGRAEVGLSNQLSQWRNLAHSGAQLLVASGEAILHRLQVKKQLLDLWAQRNEPSLNLDQALKNIHPKLKIDAVHCEAFRSSRYFGEWYAQIVKPQEDGWHTTYPDVPIEVAIEQFQTILADASVSETCHTSIR